MKSKLKFVVPLVLVLAGGVYKFVLAKPGEAAEHKIAGAVYVLPKEFLVNLAGGRYAKLGVGLVFAEHFVAAPEAGAEGAPAAPPPGYGVLTQEAVIRDIVTDVLTNSAPKNLTTQKGRAHLKERLLRRVHFETDVEVEDLLLMDIAVQ